MNKTGEKPANPGLPIHGWPADGELLLVVAVVGADGMASQSETVISREDWGTLSAEQLATRIMVPVITSLRGRVSIVTTKNMA